MAGPVQVRGLRELTRDFRLMNIEVAKDIAMDLEEAAQPVATRSSQIILSGPPVGLRNMPATSAYATMRVGQDAKGTVYVVPAWRARGGRGRPNIAKEFQPRMDKALEENEEKVVTRLDMVLARLGGEFGFY